VLCELLHCLAENGIDSVVIGQVIKMVDSFGNSNFHVPDLKIAADYISVSRVAESTGLVCSSCNPS
jgi:hypothetical protein